MKIEVTETRNVKIGDKVTMSAFVDCFGKQSPERKDYIVRRIVLMVEPDPYYRIEAYNPSNPFSYVEGSERFYEVA